MKPLRILQIVPTLGYGGVAQFLLNYYRQMDHSHIAFDFITHGSEETFHKELMESGSRIFYFKSIGKVGFFGYMKQLKELFSSNQFDIVHTHNGHLTGLTAMMCKYYYKGPVLCHAHTTLCVNKKHRPFMPIFRFLSRHYSDKLLGCGVKACEYCFGKDSNYTVIHNAISLERFWEINKSEVDSLKNALSIPVDAFIVGHVGLFTPPKNHNYMLKILQQVLHNHPNTYFIFVGGGDLKPVIEQEAEHMSVSEHIRFAGIQKNIPLYMHTFDSFILPSLHEGLPVVGIEAQSVVKNVCFADTIDKDVDTGIGNVSFIPIDESSINKWEKAIFAVREQPSKEKIRACFIKNGYEIGESVKTLYNIYSDLVNGTRK